MELELLEFAIRQASNLWKAASYPMALGYPNWPFFTSVLTNNGSLHRLSKENAFHSSRTSFTNLMATVIELAGSHTVKGRVRNNMPRMQTLCFWRG
eukprot:1606505-Amphidinium_carterae.2